jgi:hypothetical protein
VLLSDGASRLVDLFELATWEELVALQDASGPAELPRQVRAAEAVDPEVAGAQDQAQRRRHRRLPGSLLTG